MTRSDVRKWQAEAREQRKGRGDAVYFYLACSVTNIGLSSENNLYTTRIELYFWSRVHFNSVPSINYSSSTPLSVVSFNMPRLQL